MSTKKNRLHSEKLHGEDGMALLACLLILTLGLIIGAGMIDSSSSNTKTRALVKTRTDYYYEVEETLNKTVAWMQDNSQYLVDAFIEANFDNNFDTGSPSLGGNEGEHFGVYSMVKMKGTNNSVMLTNNDFFGTPAFPDVNHIESGIAFDAISSFQNADLGEANARIILIWARETDKNFEPIFRVDVVTGNNPDRGVHSFSYAYTALEATSSDVGFYGKNHVTTNTANDCWSLAYSHNGASWDRGAPRANCPIGSNSMVSLKSKVNGTVDCLSEPCVSLLAPGGDVSGDVCEGGSCHGYTLPVLSDWATYCPTHNGDLNVGGTISLPTGGCWRDIHISNNSTLVLSDVTAPYYFRTLEFDANAAKFDISSVPVGEKLTIYVETFSNTRVNGNQFYNAASAPHQLEIYYLGTDEIELNGTADFNAVFISPYADLDVSGNFNFYGALFAKSLDVSGSSNFFYDEAVGSIPIIKDLNVTLRKASQRYR